MDVQEMLRRLEQLEREVEYLRRQVANLPLRPGGGGGGGASRWVEYDGP